MSTSLKRVQASQCLTTQVPFARVDCSGNELEYVRQVLESGWLTTASKADELERRFASHLNVNHALAVNSCTSALHLALEALNIGPGDKVLLPTMTFTATAEVIRYMDAVPVLMDVDPRTSLVTESIAASALAEHPDASAMIVVHYGGQPAAMVGKDGNGIVALCRRMGISIIEDAAHAFPAHLNGDYVGNFGDVTCFSFYANKTMTTGEGGMAVTNCDKLAARMRLMRLHGIDRDIWRRYIGSAASWEYDVVAPGFKYNMPDLNAAVGLAQLERAEVTREHRMLRARVYSAAFKNHPFIRLLDCDCRPEEHSWHLFPILLQGELMHKRNEFIDHLIANGVGVSVHYKPLHHLSYYRDKFDFKAEHYPGAEALWQSTISLPIYGSLTDDEQDYVIDAVHAAAQALS
ncbi:MAG: DegT/DnrJ/EryC1/StrS family aminotransferase [Granulosicoccus sp.]